MCRGGRVGGRGEERIYPDIYERAVYVTFFSFFFFLFAFFLLVQKTRLIGRVIRTIAERVSETPFPLSNPSLRIRMDGRGRQSATPKAACHFGNINRYYLVELHTHERGRSRLRVCVPLNPAPCQRNIGKKWEKEKEGNEKKRKAKRPVQIHINTYKGSKYTSPATPG